MERFSEYCSVSPSSWWDGAQERKDRERSLATFTVKRITTIRCV